ncbi:MAG: hypothetical protein HUJ97_05815, partial [Bacteroidales bacterium]|nr:hypothetical protein [Bacteroidales bacterium]
MKRIILSLFTATFIAISLQAQQILPQPAQMKVAEGAVPFQLSEKTVLKVNDEGLFYNEIYQLQD